MMKLAMALLMTALLEQGALAAERDVRCFQSVGLKNPIRLRLDLPQDAPGLAQITYQNGSGPIAIRRTAEQERRRGPTGRPSEVSSIWKEQPPAGSGNTYVLISQGALVSSFTFIRKKDGASIRFNEDALATAAKGCRWGKP